MASFIVCCEKKAAGSFKVGGSLLVLSYHPSSPQSQHLPCALSLKSSPSQSVSLSFIRSVWVRSKESQPSEISNVSDPGVTAPGCFPEASGSLRFARLLSCPPGLGCQSPGESPGRLGEGGSVLFGVWVSLPAVSGQGALGCAFPGSLRQALR